MRDDFCIFILSHNRVGNIPTIKTLEKAGYTGDYYIIVDNKDDTKEYKEEYGKDKVIVFNKEEIAKKVDQGDNLERKDTPLYARNKVFEMAEELEYTYFMMLDDDYGHFEWKFNKDFEFGYNSFDAYEESFDELVNKTIKFLEESGLYTICMAQTGDFIGGKKASIAKNIMTKRKAMNSFLCKTDRPIEFIGRLNDDVNTYLRKQQLGKTMLTYNFLCVVQEGTQQGQGGLTNTYLDKGTYVKSFYTILYSPSCVSLITIGDNHRRIHHKIEWNKAVPKIVPEKYKVS